MSYMGTYFFLYESQQRETKMKFFNPFVPGVKKNYGFTADSDF